MSSKYREYARSKTSLRGRSVNGNARGIFNSVKVSASNTANKFKESFVDGMTTAYNTAKSADELADEYRNKVLSNTVSIDTKSDSRSQSANFYNGTDEGGDIFVNKMSGIALIKNLSMVNALPPIPDNVVDPPPIWFKADIKKDIRSWGPGGGILGDRCIVGRDYLQRVIARGQFLTLVPLDIIPNISGNAGAVVEKVVDSVDVTRFFEKAGSGLLKSLDERLNNVSYGLTTKVNSIKYFRAVNAHMKAALMSLGIDIFSDATNLVNQNNLKRFLPDQMVDKLFGKDAAGLQSVKSQLGQEAKTGNDDSDYAVNDANNVKSYNLTDFWSGTAKQNANPVATENVMSASERVATESYSNLLKYITNIDETDEQIISLPMVTFYCNGPVERSIGASVALGESAIAKATTDIGSKITNGFVNNAQGKGAALVAGMASSGEDYIREMAYHRNIGGFLVSNTYIPNVIKSATLDMQYTVNIRDVAVSSDRYSIARLFWTLSQLFPFVIQTNNPDQSLLVPSSPMYCSAFIKGIMNLPRAAITSLSIRTNPEFQTTEGIPTEIDITLTIQPLFSQSTMPNFDKFYNGSNSPEYLAAAMFNPLSSFNIIATLCGQNTIMTKLQYGLLEFFVVGSITTFWDNIKNTGAVLHSTWQDWWASEKIMKNSVMSRTRIVGDV